MNPLRQALVDYLSVRRALGYKLVQNEQLLAQFLTYLEDLGQQHLSTETALAWATLPTGAHRSWWSCRLSIIRGFAVHLKTIDPETEVPPSDLLPWRSCRATSTQPRPTGTSRPHRNCSRWPEAVLSATSETAHECARPDPAGVLH